MTLAQQYAAAVFPDTWVILGRRMVPLTLGHAVLLTRMASPFAPFTHPKLGYMPALGDVALAAWICSRPWRVAAERLQWRRTGWLLRWWAWCAARSAANRVDIARAWAAYFEAEISAPKMWLAEKQSKRLSSPVLQILILTRMTQFGEGFEAALDTPLRRALLDAAGLGEMRGTIEVQGDDDSAWIRDLIARQAARLKKAGQGEKAGTEEEPVPGQAGQGEGQAGQGSQEVDQAAGESPESGGHTAGG